MPQGFRLNLAIERITSSGGCRLRGFAVSKERPDTGFDYEAPDFFGRSFDVGLRVFEEVIKQFATCDVGCDGIVEFAPGLLAEDLIPKPFRVLNVSGSRRADHLLPIDVVGQNQMRPRLKIVPMPYVALPLSAL